MSALVSGGRISRDPLAAAGREYDLIVVGGGIQGCFVALEAARAGLRPLVLERGDFGGGTSWNSLRIIHGGLRHLQSMDFRRLRDSDAERRWFLEHFPDLVRPLGCMMPLYGEGLHRPAIFRAAFLAGGLAIRVGRGAEDREDGLPLGRILNTELTRQICPSLPGEGLRGSAFWYDAVMVNPSRMLVEVLRWACASGAVALNYVECVETRVRRGVVDGVRAVDRVTGRHLTFKAPVCVNAAGVGGHSAAGCVGTDRPPLLNPTIAFNLLLRRAAPSAEALAVTPRSGRRSRTYFLLPVAEGILAGTYHGKYEAGEGTGAGEQEPKPSEEAVKGFLDDLNRAIPALELRRSDVVRILCGLLPGEGVDAWAPRDDALIVDHRELGGPAGLFSVAAVKYTLARRVAARMLKALTGAGSWSPTRTGARRRRLSSRPAALAVPRVQQASDPGWPGRSEDERVVAALTEIIEAESVVHLDDLLLRRTDWGLDPERGREVLARIAPLLDRIRGWDRRRAESERFRTERILNEAASVTGSAKGPPSDAHEGVGAA